MEVNSLPSVSTWKRTLLKCIRTWTLRKCLFPEAMPLLLIDRRFDHFPDVDKVDPEACKYGMPSSDSMYSL